MNTLSPPLLDVPNAMEFMLLYVIRDTECYCGVRYFQLSQLVELRRIRSAIFPPNEKASCAEYVAPGFCCITSAALLPKSLGSPFGLTVVANIMHFGGLSMSVTSVAYSGDTENYANEMTGPPAEMTVTQFQSVDLKVTVAPSLLHVGALSFPASFTANFATPETKYRHAFPFPLPSIMTSATARC